MPLPVIAVNTDALYCLSPEGTENSMRSLMWLVGFADSRRKVKNALDYSISKEQREATENPPHFPCRKGEGLQPKILIF